MRVSSRHSRRALLALVIPIVLASGCGSSSKSGTASSSAAQLRFREWLVSLQLTGKAQPKRGALPNGGHLYLVHDCTAKVVRIVPVFVARGLHGKQVTYHILYTPPRGKPKLLFNGTNSQIRDGEGGLTFNGPPPRGFTGDGRFSAEFLLGKKQLGSGSFNVLTRPRCRRQRRAAGLLAQ